MMLKREPTLVVMVIVSLINAGLVALDIGPLDSDAAELLANTLLTIAGALLVRSRVFSEHTIREAGMTPSQVEAMAESPSIKPAVGP